MSAHNKESAVLITQGCYVRMHLALVLPDGTEALTTFADEPESFRLGDGSISPGLETLIIGKKRGDRDQLTLAPEQAFGARLAENQQLLPREEFAPDMSLEPGMVIAFETPSGDQLPGTVVRADEQQVTVDFNHPLAGRDLVFKYEILDVAPAVEHTTK